MLHDLLSNDSSSEEDILQAIRDDPEALRRADGGSNLPLHLECQHQCRSAIIMKCIELYPESLSLANQADALPLHLLLSNYKSATEDALMMIEEYPAALRVDGCQLYWTDRYLPLHIECKNRCRSVVISKCIELYPQSLAETRKDASLPLHLLLRKKASSIEDALLMIEKYPEALRCRTQSYFPDSKYLPIHEECKNQCRLTVLSKCIELFPESLTEVDENIFPLHLVLSNPATSIDTILLFISKYPSALKCANAKGYLPLHIECSYQSRSPVISKCIELYPESLSMATKDDALPLHLLLSNDFSSLEDALMMIHEYPDALQCGRIQPYCSIKYLPLHLECMNRCRSTILSKCIELYPESLAKSSEEDSLPLHLLLSNLLSASEDALLMIEKYPNALKFKKYSNIAANAYLPIHLECKNRCRSAIISKCIELYPESLAEVDDQRMPPLSLLLSNSSSSVDVVLMVMCAYPDALKCKEYIYLDLPLHIECKNQCRSAILSKSVELYPESLFIVNRYNALPLHSLLSNHKSSIEDTLIIICKYPEALRCYETSISKNEKSLPLHIECKNQCRSAVISKCIELYPEALSISTMNNPLPLLILLRQPQSPTDTALMMIDKYPEALRSTETVLLSDDKFLPLHLECMNECRSAIISKCIELYPEALSIASRNNSLPLHLLLSNQVSSIEDALTMIDKYPQALKLRNNNSNRSTDLVLPIHIECSKQCRPTVLSKCIALFPQSLAVCDADGDIPWTITLNKLFLFSYERVFMSRKSLFILLSAHPASFYHPPHDPWINRHPMMQAPASCRLILNLLPSCLSSAAHLQAYHDLNWQPRCSLLQLWLQIRLKSDQVNSRSSLEQLLSMTEPCHQLNSKDSCMRLLMVKMLEQSSLLVAIGGRGAVEYSVDLGDGISDLMLRFIMAYL
jgi:tetratricopeptide (TPR) repeat protein